MHAGVGLTESGGALSRYALVVAAVACSPAQPRPMAPAPTPEAADIPRKRVDSWRYVDLSLARTPVESQLKRHFERAFANAQFSKAHTCVAREFANFREKHAAEPDEELETEMWGRCGATGAGQWMSQEYYSDGTLLDSPLPEELLRDITVKLTAGLAPFTVFGITARYLGPNALFALQTGAPDATLHIDEADAEGTVHLKGKVFGDFARARALINQGEAGTAECEPDTDVDWPEYAFDCRLAPGDERAWVSLNGFEQAPGSWEIPLLFLPAHQAGWAAPAEYQRRRLVLPEQTDTRGGLAAALNQLRRSLGRPALHLASAQSQFIQSTYEQVFALNSQGDWENDTHLMAQMLRGDRVEGAVTWGRIVSGIAHDGDAADWLAFRLLLPVSRETLMLETTHQVAIAMQGDPTIGFGAAAVVYSVATPEQEEELADILAQGIAKRRDKRPTQLLASPAELEAITNEVAIGSEPPEAFLTALQRSNLTAGRARYRGGVLVPMNSSSEDFAMLLEPMLRVEKLEYGIIIKHVRFPDERWAEPIAFVWFYTDVPPQQEAKRRRVQPPVATGQSRYSIQ